MVRFIHWMVATALTLAFSVTNVLAADTIHYIHANALGSPVAATNESGDLVWREKYRPYGERILDEAGDKKIWFTGKLEESATGLMYYGARWYHPVLGRFTGVDPVPFKEGNIHSFNRYAYANNNPYAFVDPDGRDPDFVMMIDPGAYMELRGAELGVDATNRAGADVVMQQMRTEALYEIGGYVLGGAAGRTVGKMGGLTTKGASKLNTKIKWSQQEKHLPGHNSYTPGRSTLTSNPENLATKAGTGQQVGKTPVGSPGSRERVDFGERIGTYIDRGGNASDTTKGIIHYGKDGIHIVPARP